VILCRAGAVIPMLRDIFDEADIDGSGSLDAVELAVSHSHAVVSHAVVSRARSGRVSA